MEFSFLRLSPILIRLLFYSNIKEQLFFQCIDTWYSLIQNIWMNYHIDLYSIQKFTILYQLNTGPCEKREVGECSLALIQEGFICLEPLIKRLGKKDPFLFQSLFRLRRRNELLTSLYTGIGTTLCMCPLMARHTYHYALCCNSCGLRN